MPCPPKPRTKKRSKKLSLLRKRGNAGERCLRRQCEISIVCDDGSFSSPKECASALSFSSPKECSQACKAGREMETATRNIYLLHRKRSPFSYQREGVLNKRREKVTTVPMVCADTPVRPFYTPRTPKTLEGSPAKVRGMYKGKSFSLTIIFPRQFSTLIAHLYFLQVFLSLLFIA